MKKHTWVFFVSVFQLCIISQAVNAQTVTLGIRQQEPLRINTPGTAYKILTGNKIVLGKDLSITGGSGTYQMRWSCTSWKTDSVKNTITIAPSVSTSYLLKVTDQNKCTIEQSFQVDVVPLLQVKYSINSISCPGRNDGKINLTITGGEPPYSAIWSNGEKGNSIENLASGNYSVTVTDNMKQTQRESISIKEPEEIRVTHNISICKGETYQLAGSELKESGKYNSTLKSKFGCDSIVTVNLTVNPTYEQPITASICKGESYRFANVDYKESGQYKNYLKTKNGCDSIIVLNLNVNPTFEKIFNEEICQGETYWFLSKDYSLTGQYKETLKTKNGCDSTLILNLRVNVLPAIPLITQRGDTLNSSVISGNQWYKEGKLLDGETKPQLIITQTGDYSLTVTNEKGCSSSSDVFEAIKTEDFSCDVFPNPNNGVFTVELVLGKSEPLTLALYDAEGKRIVQQSYKYPPGKYKVQFGKTNLALGLYTLRVQLGSRFESRKLIINQ